jgi:hypothetical protein
MTGVERIIVRRIGVDGDEEHVGAVIEDALRAVAGVDVDVEDRHAAAFPAQVFRRDRGVVEVAEAARHIAIGMMARRPAERVGVPFAGQHQARRMHRRLGAGAGRAPGVGRDRAGGVGLMIARQPDGGARPLAHVAVRVDVGDHLVAGVGQLPPFRMDVLEKIEVFRRVHRGERRQTVVVGRHHLVARSLRRRQQHGCAFRLVRAALDAAAHDEGLRVMRKLALVEHEFHDATSAVSRPVAGGCQCLPGIEDKSSCV